MGKYNCNDIACSSLLSSYRGFPRWAFIWC